jgi:carbonic anhydrase/acetyltransferase-like protein (isoleucine patch superfamily)
VSLRLFSRDERDRRRIARDTARVLRGPAAEAFASFGARSTIVPPTRVTRPDRIHIGEGVLIHEGGWLSVVEAHPGHPPRLEIGDRCRFGRELSIACVGEIVIGREVSASDGVFIADCYHEYRDPWTPILHQPMSVPQRVEIGAGAYLGAASIVLAGVTIGANAYVGEGAVVTTDVPAGGVVYGNPARLVKVVG